MGNDKKYPKTVEEAVNQLISELPIHDKRRISNMSEDALGNLHFSLGQVIRNEFGLWAGNEELLESCRSVAGKTDLHIDSASSVIIEALWERLQQFPPPKLVKEGHTYGY